MLRLVYANRTEALVEAFVHAIARDSPLAPVDVVVPSRHIERFLVLQAAERTGIVANLRFHRLESLTRRVLSAGGAPPLDRAAYQMGVLGALQEEGLLQDPVFASVRDYLDVAESDGARDVRLTQLAMRLGIVFEGYALSRPEFLEHWRAGRPALPSDVSAAARDDERWQRLLFQRVLERTGRLPIASKLAGLRGGDGPLHVFGLSYVARSYVHVLAALANAHDLHLFTLNPCREFWEDVPSAREVRGQRSFNFGEAVAAPFLASDPPILSLFGRPGREHTRNLNALAEAGFDACFESPGEGTLLACVQSDVLDREVRKKKLVPDGSIVARACPSVRREVEAVAEAIWSAVRTSPDLRFNEIAVFVPSDQRAVYLPAIEAVFSEAQRLPHHVVDLPLLQESAVVAGALELLRLPMSAMRRPDLMRVLTHPALRGPRSESWPELIDDLGVFHGIDGSDHDGTYIEGDVLTWDQAVRRLALGYFMEDSPFETAEQHYFPLVASADDEASTLLALIRSLCADVRFARHARLPIPEWSRFFSGMFSAYLDGSEEESALRRCLAAAESLAFGAEEGGAFDAVGYACAAELLSASLLRLGGNRGEYLAEGVVVSALAPMRAIPFRQLFVLGLGEGVFPSVERRDPLDLRRVKRVDGDVLPAERDKYVFLEALLSARDAFHVSWVARDAMTGDPVPSSSVVDQLLAIVSEDYLGGASLEVKVPLRRHEEVDPHTPLREALAEARAVRAEAAPSAPSPSREDSSRVEIRLSSLRSFLEAPAQGWARAVLRLYSVQDEAHVGKADEPLVASGFERAMLLRSAFEEGLVRRAPPEACYRARSERLQAAGRWPVGLLAERLAARDRDCFASWKSALRASASFHGRPPHRVLFGDVEGPRDWDGGTSRRDAIELRVGERRVRLVGSTELMLEDGTSSLLLLAREAPKGALLQRERLRYALRGYIDALALAAAGDERPRRAMMLYGAKTARELSTRFCAFSQGDALAILQMLSAELLSGSHAYDLPCEAVFRVPWGSRSADALSQALAIERGRATRGPLEDERALRELSGEEALAIVERRFAPFFASVGP